MKLQGLAKIAAVTAISLGVAGRARGASITYENVNIVKPQAQIQTESPWNEYNGHFYRLTLEPMTWIQSEQYAISQGAHLVTINDAEENQWVSANFEGIIQKSFFIGFYEPSEGNAWQWISGEPVTYAPQGIILSGPDSYSEMAGFKDSDGIRGWQGIDGETSAQRAVIETPSPSSLAILGAGALAYSVRRRETIN